MRKQIFLIDTLHSDTKKMNSTSVYISKEIKLDEKYAKCIAQII